MLTDLKILIVEDELIAAENLKEFLEEQECVVLGITDRGSTALELAKKLQPDIIMMDIMLKDGLSGCEAALQISRFCPAKIIFLSAYALDEMLDYAAQAKAAGYLIKPYNKTQILTTLRLVTREGLEATPPENIQLLQNYRFNLQEEQLYHDGKVVKLGPRARRLLALLCTAPGCVISNEQIYMHIWGEEVDDAALRALVYRIRIAIGASLIQNENGAGYKIVLA